MQASSEYFDVVVLGGGAAGLMCACTAAQRGRSVLLLEKANKIGKKILMSGGGRCNFTNRVVEADNYLSANPHFCKSALSRYTQWDFISLVERYEIDYEERKHFQLFCIHSAKDILGMLVQECQSAGVATKLQCDISRIQATEPVKPGQQAADSSRYQIDFKQSGESCRVDCASLVVATGALSIPTLGGSGMGYDIATQFGLPVTDRRAGLVPFMFTDATRELCERLAGIALEVSVSCKRQFFHENILFTHRGLSGPAVLQISNYWQPGDLLTIDLLPEQSAAQWLAEAKQDQGRTRLARLLNKALPRALVAELQQLWWPKMVDASLDQFSDRQLRDIGDSLNNWQLKPSGTEGYRTAEVTLGGVNTDSISSKTMEVKQIPGLYFIGEVLDVTGHLGGFNFQWAWSSGYSAGMHA